MPSDVPCVECGGPTREAGGKLWCADGACDWMTMRARVRAHEAFDALWKVYGMGRTAAYRWLASRLGLPRERAHISQLTRNDCARVVAIVDKALPWRHREAG